MSIHAQKTFSPSKKEVWADSVLATLSPDERIAQLMVIRTSAPGKEGKAIFYDSLTDVLVKQYNIGGVCLFQGTPFEQAALLNRIQGMAKTPIMVTVDGEWGLGMRFAGVRSFPYQLTLGAAADADLTYRVGRAMAAQCRRMNIHVNYAPVVDVNNNPLNPVIGYRSFGESREQVALLGTRIMKGLQDNGVMACAKHFPGHGDVAVDSHHDLPVIQKTRTQLDSLELYPFRSLFANGVGSVMVAHLSIPAIDSTQNRPTSLSYNNITGLMREKLGYQGLTFTDALEMKGVAKFFPGGEAAIESLAAGNDMLCLPANVPQTIAEIKAAIEKGRLSWRQIEEKCRKVLLAKYDYVIGKTERIDTTGLLADLNREVPLLRRETAEKAFTLVKAAADFAPVGKQAADVWVLQVGGKTPGVFAGGLAARGATVAVYTEADTALLLNQANKAKYKRVVISLQQLGRNPANNFGLSDACLRLLHQVANRPGTVLVVQGNPYALGALQKAAFKTVAVAYEDDAIFQQTAFDWITGLFRASGKLPVSVGRFKAGAVAATLPAASPEQVGMRGEVLQQIDKVAQQGIDSAAFPGCVVAVLRKGQLVFSKAYGYTTYTKEAPVSLHTIFDLASVSKISATTIALMHLYEQGRLNLKATLGSYLPAMQGTNKADITIESMLLHQSGLVSFIPFYRNVIDEAGNPLPRYFRNHSRGKFKIPVTEKWYMNKRYLRTMYQAIGSSKLYDSLPRYVYS
ncbi:MAG: serine hydrolase, partial [Chitinophagaceae bacterium]|nr:serine hydrolase [Chitinophagaceae bacterium]